MSAETRNKKKALWTEPEPSLPVELLLEIIALTDPTTVVRCAATGKNLRRAILEPAFRHRLAAEDALDPALLLGISLWEDGNVRRHRIIHTPGPGPAKLRARLDGCGLRESFKPVASRDSLFILRRHGAPPELRACDTLTGHATPLPPPSLPAAYHHVVLSVAGNSGRLSYELLVADKNALCYQTFSSKDGRWSAIRQVSVSIYLRLRENVCQSDCSAVIGRTVFWPCRVHAGSHWHWDHVFALDLDAGEATLMELPRDCLSRMMAVKNDSHLRLAAVRGRLCLFVAESGGMATWTLTSPMSTTAATWSRQVVISSMEIARQMGLAACPSTLTPLSLLGFGERSGAVIVSWLPAGGFLRLHLGTDEEPPVVTKLVTHGDDDKRVTRLFFHEIGLASLLQAMKPF